jgi:hypothetical protein
MIEQIKKALLYVVAPIAGVLAYIVYLRNTIVSLKGTIAESKVSKELADILVKKEIAHEEANSAVNDYYAIRDEFLKSSGTKPDSEH